MTIELAYEGDVVTFVELGLLVMRNDLLQRYVRDKSVLYNCVLSGDVSVGSETCRSWRVVMLL
jgi:hypothetical protein